MIVCSAPGTPAAIDGNGSINISVVNEPDYGACHSASLWAVVVENINIFVMGLFLMLHILSVVHDSFQNCSRMKQNLDNPGVKIWL